MRETVSNICLYEGVGKQDGGTRLGPLIRDFVWADHRRGVFVIRSAGKDNKKMIVFAGKNSYKRDKKI